MTGAGETKPTARPLGRRRWLGTMLLAGAGFALGLAPRSSRALGAWLPRPRAFPVLRVRPFRMRDLDRPHDLAG